MKIKGTMVFLLTVAVILLLIPGSLVFSQQKMKMDEYKVQLAETQKQEIDATAKIATLTAENEGLKKQINETQAQIDASWNDIYAAIGTDKAGVDAYRADLNDIGAKLDALMALSPEELLKSKEEVADLEKRLQELKASKIANLTEMQDKIAALEANLSALSTKLEGINDKYTVIKGDYLWKIAKKPDIYNDPYQWIRIFCVNRDNIKNADLIYPEQVLTIQRTLAKNEYLVQKGDDLKKIAGSVLGDPAKWTKIYESNKDVISNPQMLYPWQVLSVPKE
jgi:nucleoid-associated protein YgaU